MTAFPSGSGRDSSIHFTSTVLGWLSFALLVCAYPLAFALPHWLSWENQPIEVLQSAVLFIGMVQAIVLWWQSESHSKWLWLAAVPIWLIVSARELSWGAVLYPSTASTAHGPLYSSSELWFKPAVYPIVVALAVFSFVVIVSKRLWRFGTPLIRDAQFLWCLGIVVAGALISTAAEGHLWFRFGLDRDDAQLFEEFAELAAHLALVAAQCRLYVAVTLKEAE